MADDVYRCRSILQSVRMDVEGNDPVTPFESFRDIKKLLFRIDNGSLGPGEPVLRDPGFKGREVGLADDRNGIGILRFLQFREIENQNAVLVGLGDKEPLVEAFKTQPLRRHLFQSPPFFRQGGGSCKARDSSREIGLTDNGYGFRVSFQAVGVDVKNKNPIVATVRDVEVFSVRIQGQSADPSAEPLGTDSHLGALKIGLADNELGVRKVTERVWMYIKHQDSVVGAVGHE